MESVVPSYLEGFLSLSNFHDSYYALSRYMLCAVCRGLYVVIGSLLIGTN